MRRLTPSRDVMARLPGAKTWAVARGKPPEEIPLYPTRPFRDDQQTELFSAVLFIHLLHGFREQPGSPAAKSRLPLARDQHVIALIGFFEINTFSPIN